MGRTAILAIRIIGDAREAVSAMDSVDGSARSMQSTMDRASVGAGIALGGLAMAALQVGNAASEAQQAAGAVDSVFGQYSDNVKTYAANASQAVGLAQDEYGNLAAVIGSQLKNMGVPMEAVAGQTDGLITMGADLAATFGGTTSDAVSALSSLLRGERDPIERYGVSMKQADIDAKKAAMGLSGLTGEADKAATTQATLALLTEQTASAQGQFGREADSAAGMQQRANAEWQNAQIALGEQLLPVMTEGARIAADLAKWIGENEGIVTALAIAIGILAAGILVINGVMKAYAAIQAIQTAAQWASNTAWLASPITWIVLAVVAAIALVIAIVILVIENWDELAAVAEDVWNGIIGWIQDAYEWLVGNITTAIQGVMDFFNSLGDTVANAFSTVVDWIKDAYKWLMKMIGNAVPGWVKDLLGMNGKSARIAVAVEEPSARVASFAAPMAFAASADTASRMAPAAFAAPMAFATTTPNLGGALARDEQQQPVVNNTYNVTVEGAVDVDGTARTIEDILKKHTARTGRATTTGGSAWR